MLNNILELLPEDVASFINENWKLLLSVGGTTAFTGSALFIKRMVKKSKNILQAGADKALEIGSKLQEKKEQIEELEVKLKALKKDLKMYIACKNVDATIDTKKQIDYIKNQIEKLK